MKKNNKKAELIKIEMDESAEPVIVKVSADEKLKSTTALEESAVTSEKDESGYSGKQMSIANVFLPNEKTKEIDKRQKKFKVIITSAFIVLVVAVLGWTFYNDFFAPNPQRQPFNWDSLWITLGTNWYYIICAILSLFFLFSFKGIKLSLLCKKFTKKWQFKTCLETSLIGIYYNNVTPLAVGGQPFEAINLNKRGLSAGLSAGFPISTFFLNQFSFVIMGILALGFLSLNKWDDIINQLPPAITIMAIIGLISCIVMPLLVVVCSILPRCAGALVKFFIRIGNKLHIVKNAKKTTYLSMRTVLRNSQCVKSVATSPWLFILSFLFSVGEQLANCSIAYFTLRFFGFDLPDVGGFLEWLMIVQLCIILYAAVSFIPTPGNSGAADLSFYVLFSTGLMSGLAFPAMIVWRFLCFYLIILIGFAYTNINRKKINKRMY